MFRRLLHNEPLANLTFLFVLVMGTLAYLHMPRAEDPSVNLNWVVILTPMPGASASDVEKRITDPLEDAIAKVSDVKFVSSNSRNDFSNILVRFNNISKDTFNKRISDLRREIQNKLQELPQAAGQPNIIPVTSTNAFPAAVVLVTGNNNGQTLHRQAFLIRRDLERLNGVARVDANGDPTPELQVLFSPEKLVGLGVRPTALADTVSAYFHDLSAGSLNFGGQQWLLRLTGTNSNPGYLANLPILTAHGEVPLRSVANVVMGRKEPTELARYHNKPTVMLNVYKKENANVLRLVAHIKHYMTTRNRVSDKTGVRLVLLDDRTQTIKSALSVMENNAALGFLLVMVVMWVFLGLRIAVYAALGFPFILAATFWLLSVMGQTLNVVVLLGIVISLGMLVDDAVVVVEAIYLRLQRGMDALSAATEALREVVAPVTSSSLTTIAAFLPLMLLPGVLGKFMMVVPLVVTTTLVISLLEAYWLLPIHVIRGGIHIDRTARLQRYRERLSQRLQRTYARWLVRVLRKPMRHLAMLGLLAAIAAGCIALGVVRINFFAGDSYRFFYVNVKMPPGTNLDKTLATTLEIENAVRSRLHADETRAVAAYAGLQITEESPIQGDQYGQIFVSLKPYSHKLRSVDAIIANLRPAVQRIPGPEEVSFLKRKLGPPTSKPINIKVRGNDPRQLRKATKTLIGILKSIPAVTDIADDDTQGPMELDMRLDPDAVTRAGLNPADVARNLRLMVAGQIAATMQYHGEKLNVRVRAKPAVLHDIDGFLHNTLSLPSGGEIPLGQLVTTSTQRSTANIRHFNLRRAITVTANLKPGQMNTLSANNLIVRKWKRFTGVYPNVDLDFSGELGDIKQSLNSIGVLFLFGVGLIYLILGTQFRNYTQPLLILVTVPMAFIGVVFGLLVSHNPLSLYTLYGVVALAGIAVNAAIILVATANSYVARGTSVIHATVNAARRRVIPVLITSLTTIAGLVSLAAGLGGKSLMWGPVATAIVWGLSFSTALTLFVVPLLYSFTTKPKPATAGLPLPPLLPSHDARMGERLRLRLRRLSEWVAGKREQAEFDVIATNKALNRLYSMGTDHLAAGRFEEAVKAFEQAVELSPASKALNIYAAQALIMHMQKNGWDIGYIRRAKRHLARAKRLAPNDPRVVMLQQAYDRLEGDRNA